jgi:hypothetical protein
MWAPLFVVQGILTCAVLNTDPVNEGARAGASRKRDDAKNLQTAGEYGSVMLALLSVLRK